MSKFQTALAEKAWESACSGGAADEAGDSVSGPGFIALVQVDQAEWVVVSEDTQGFVDVEAQGDYNTVRQEFDRIATEFAADETWDREVLA